MNGCFNVPILSDIQKEKCIFQYQMNVTLSNYFSIKQTKTKNKKKTATKTSIMYNQ